MKIYVIAGKRSLRDETPVKLAEYQTDIESLQIFGHSKLTRLIVIASACAIEQTRLRVSEMCYIEPEIKHISQ
jgi:hypothetical protein